MKAYLILTQSQHSTEVFFEDQKGRETKIKGGKMSIKNANIFERMTNSLGKRYARIFFAKKDAVANIISPSIVDSILKSFKAAQNKGIVKQYQMKAFFIIKSINIALNTKKKVYSCEIMEKDIIVENQIRLTKEAINIKQEKISALQMKNSMMKAIPGVYNLLTDIDKIPKDIFDSMSKEAKDIANQLKYGLKEIPLSQIQAVDMLIEATNIAKEMNENEQKTNLN